ncbi:MAG: AAA family ATPase [Eubacteriales bacterium]|nr:AAA family ATPase [Eubacteriales bacterium]
MKIAKVHIENFRSIKQLDFSPGNYCALIGENNAGKSNVLKAINLVLGETWPTDRSISEDDFHGYDTAKDIVIQVYFDAIIEEWKNNCKCEVSGFELRGKAYKRRYKSKPAGTITVDFYCIDKNGKPCQYPATPYKSGERYTGPYVSLKVSRELRKKVPFIYVDVMRDYSKQDPGNRWSILRRLFNDINLSLSTDKALVAVKTKDGEQKMTRKQAFEFKIKEAYSYLQTDEFLDVEEKIRVNSLEQMGIDPKDGDIAIGFDTYDTMNVFKNLQLYVDQMGISTTADMVGAGLQSAIVIAIFRTYEEIKKEGAIFAIEEPEVYLHPQKQRYFSNILSNLGVQNQVFITTHSPTFVRLYEPENVCLIRRNNTYGTTAKICEKEHLISSEKEALKIENYFDNQRNEMFFAKAVLLVEGATEKFVFPLIGRLMEWDFDRHGVSIIECGGKGNLCTFAKVASAFDIPYVVVADDDIKDLAEITDETKRQKIQRENENHRTKNAALIATVPSDLLFWMLPNIEAELGINENSDNKIKQALAKIKSEDFRRSIPEAIAYPVNKLIEIVNKK